LPHVPWGHHSRLSLQGAHLISHLPCTAPFVRGALAVGGPSAEPELMPLPRSPCFFRTWHGGGKEEVCGGCRSPDARVWPGMGPSGGALRQGPWKEILLARALAGSPHPRSLDQPSCCVCLDDSGLQRSGVLKGELHHANEIKKEKLALESFGVRKMKQPM